MVTFFAPGIVKGTVKVSISLEEVVGVKFEKHQLERQESYCRLRPLPNGSVTISAPFLSLELSKSYLPQNGF